MKATKVTVSIRAEVLSIDALPSLIAEMSELVRREAERGLVRMADGDQIEWVTERIEVEF